MPNEEVPLLSPCATTMLSKNVGGKFKYLNRKNSEFLVGNSNAQILAGNLNSKCKMQNANAKGKCNSSALNPSIQRTCNGC